MKDASAMVNPLTASIKLNTYSNELFADNFATTYGYGPEVAEFSRIFALDSTGFELLDSWNKDSKFMKTMNDMLLNYTNLFDSFNIFKDRASEITRAYDQLNYLKNNLNDIKDKKQKECIKFAKRNGRFPLWRMYRTSKRIRHCYYKSTIFVI